MQCYQFLTCTICTDIYTDPCTLYCQHTFCRNCITRYTKTRPEAIQSKTIPCPCCRQVTKVPDPTWPVEEWAKQLKPSIIIQGLIDTSQPGHNTKDTGCYCDLCEHLGETTLAISWCAECEVSLCERCTKTHRVSPASHDHDVSELSAGENVKRRRKVMCREHKKHWVEFHCKDCKKSACQKCCIVYHRACNSVLDIESMRQDMTSDLLKKRGIISESIKRKKTEVTRKKSAISKASQNKTEIQFQIHTVSQTVTSKIKQKEKQLLDKLDQITGKHVSQLQADVKTEEIGIQMYRQHCEFIDQAVNTECLMDMYSMYQACESGLLDFGDVEDTNKTEGQKVDEILFTQDSNKMRRVLDELHLGEIDVTYQDVYIDEESSSALYNTIDARTVEDKKPSCLVDVTILTVDDVQACVVTDFANWCVKSFRSNRSCLRGPWGMTKLNEKEVMVAVPHASQMVTVGVHPDLTLLKTIKTNRAYFTLAIINSLSLAAGCWRPESSVDILNMEGQLIKSVSRQHNVNFVTICSMCVDAKGNILVLDSGTKNVTCLASSGDVLWQSSHGDSTGIITTGDDDIVLAIRDPNKVIQLTETGQFVRDVVTSSSHLAEPRGIYMDTSGHLFVCEKDRVKDFVLK